MIWHWYIRRANETLADVDRPTFKPALDDCWEWIPSATPGHWHGRMELPGAVAPIFAVAYALMVGSDPIHAANDLLRIAGGHPDPVLLICTERFPGRTADFTCDCPTKHDPTTMRACPVGKRLRA